MAKFQSGHKKRGGRKKGVGNKFDSDLKAMILKALANAGGASYLTRQAFENPTDFLKILSKILPKQSEEIIKVVPEPGSYNEQLDNQLKKMGF